MQARKTKGAVPFIIKNEHTNSNDDFIQSMSWQNKLKIYWKK